MFDIFDVQIGACSSIQCVEQSICVREYRDVELALIFVICCLEKLETMKCKDEQTVGPMVILINAIRALLNHSAIRDHQAT